MEAYGLIYGHLTRLWNGWLCDYIVDLGQGSTLYSDMELVSSLCSNVELDSISIRTGIKIVCPIANTREQSDKSGGSSVHLSFD